MTSTFVLATAAMAVFDLGLALVVVRIYRWVTSPEAVLGRERVSRPAERATEPAALNSLA